MKLGHLTKISDLRSVWKDEARDFTKWLAEEKNLDTLGKEIGLNLSLVKTEAEAGDFLVDILAEETDTGKKVIIENQLEKTDHDHLGKIITYASGYGANTIIWIVKEFRSEHKSAIDWLNEHTDEKINFFGIIIELWKIGDSDVAPKFNIVSQPNSWSKTIRSSAKKSELSETGLKQLTFLEGFISYCKEHNTTLNLGNPQPSSPAYYSIGIGTSGAWIAIKINTGKKVIKVDLFFSEKELFNLTRNSTEDQARNLFNNLIWDEMPQYKGASVGLEFKNFNIDRQDTWENSYPWLMENAEKLVRFFNPVIMQNKKLMKG